MLSDRQLALQKLLHSAQAVGANAVVGLRYENDDAIFCYGTAVFVEPRVPA